MKNDKLVSEQVARTVQRVIKESKEKAPKIEKELEALRKKVCPEGVVEKRISIHTVSELLEIPVNELMLHFLNDVKTKTERSSIEYRLGQVCFRCA